jgi:hypothetical protein
LETSIVDTLGAQACADFQDGSLRGHTRTIRRRRLMRCKSKTQQIRKTVSP